jgi:hypothetical protein
VYLAEIGFLRDHLTQSTDEIEVSIDLIQRVQGSIFPDRSPDELYRLMMSLCSPTGANSSPTARCAA